MPRKRWIKLWTQETLFGTTSRELEPDERAVWFQFLALAGDSPEPGKIEIAPNVAYTSEQLCELLKITPELLDRAKKKMIQFDKISINSDIIAIKNWERYQGETERIEYMREYMRQYRKKKRKQFNSKQFNSKQFNSKQLEEEEEEEEEENNKKVVVDKATTTTLNKKLAEIIKLYEDVIGLVNKHMAEILKEFSLMYPIDWFRYAFGQASEHNKRNWAYVEKILFRLEEEYGGVPEEDEYGKIG